MIGDVLKKHEDKFKELITEQSLKITTETSLELYDFLSNLSFIDAEVIEEEHNVFLGDHDNTMTLTKWILYGKYDDFSYELGIVEYYVAGGGFANTKVLLSPDWFDATEADGTELWEEFEFPEEKAKIYDEIFKKFDLKEVVDDIHTTTLKRKKAKSINEWISKYDGATVKIEPTNPENFETSSLNIIFPDGKTVTIDDLLD